MVGYLLLQSYENPQLSSSPRRHRLSVISWSDFLNNDYRSVITLSPPKVDDSSSSSYVKILGSCNGWLCFTYGGGKYGLWNPSTNNLKLVPPFDFKCSDFNSVHHRCGGNCIISVDQDIYFHSLGYDSKSEDYKFLALFNFSLVENENWDYIMRFFIYSMNNNSWTQVEPFLPIKDMPLYYPSFVCLGAFCYWNVRDSIVSFDFTNETFSAISYPDPDDILSITRGCYLIKFFGRLGLVIYPDRGMVKQFQFWIWEADEQGFSWKRKHDLDIFSVGADMPLGFCGNPKLEMGLVGDAVSVSDMMMMQFKSVGGLGFLFQGIDGVLMKYDYSTKKMIKLHHFYDHQRLMKLFTFAYGGDN